MLYWCHMSVMVYQTNCSRTRRILTRFAPLQWRHYGRDSVSNHLPHDCLLNVYSDADQRKHQSSASLAFVRGIHRGPVNSQRKWPVTRKMLPFDDVIISMSQIWRALFVCLEIDLISPTHLVNIIRIWRVFAFSRRKKIIQRNQNINTSLSIVMFASNGGTALTAFEYIFNKGLIAQLSALSAFQ